MSDEVTMESRYGWMRAGIKQPWFPRGGWCCACGRGFTTDRAFDRHRRPVGAQRECLADEELPSNGLQCNPGGLWGVIASPRRQEALRRLQSVDCARS